MRTYTYTYIHFSCHTEVHIFHLYTYIHQNTDISYMYVYMSQMYECMYVCHRCMYVRAANRQGHVVHQLCETDLRLDHPELRQVPRGVGVLQ